MPFAVGILWEKDLDCPAARALAAEVVCVRAFCWVGAEDMERAKALIDQCAEVICAVNMTGVGDWATE